MLMSCLLSSHWPADGMQLDLFSIDTIDNFELAINEKSKTNFSSKVKRRFCKPMLLGAPKKSTIEEQKIPNKNLQPPTRLRIYKYRLLRLDFLQLLLHPI